MVNDWTRADRGEMCLAIDALRAVLDLHTPVDTCTGDCCRVCVECDRMWPCPTRQQIESALGEAS